VAAAVRIETEAEWSKVDPQSIELTVVVGTSLLSSSMLNVDAALAGLWPEGVRRSNAFVIDHLKGESTATVSATT